MPQIPKSPPVIIPAIFIGALVLFALIYQLPHTVRIDIGSSSDEALTSGFYFAEGEGDNTFRWTSGLAQINFLSFGKRDARIALRMSGIRPTGTVTVNLTINDRQPLAMIELGGAMQAYEFEIARSQIGQDGDIRLFIEAPTFQSPPDTRDLGIQVDWAEVRTSGFAKTLPPLLPWLALTVVVTLLAAAGIRLRLSSLTWWLWSGGWLFTIAAALRVAQPWVDAYLTWLVGAALLFWLISRWMYGANLVEWLLLGAVAVVGVGFTIRAVDFYHNGLPPGDFTIYFDAASNLWRSQPIYDFKAASEMPNGPVYKYPPLFAILLAPFTVFPIWNVAAGWYLFNLALYAMIFRLTISVIQQSVDVHSVDVRSVDVHSVDVRSVDVHSVDVRSVDVRSVDVRSVDMCTMARHRTFVLISALLFLVFQPTWESLIRGQLDVVILAAVMVGLWLYVRQQQVLIAGGLLAFVTMLKLYPGLLVLYLLWKQRFLAVVGFMVGFAGFTLLSGIVAGWDVMWRYVAEVLTVQTAAVPWPENQSWTGLISRFVIPAAETTWYTTIPFTSPVRWLLYALVLTTLLLTVVVLSKRTASPDTFIQGYFVTLLLMVMMWPTSWIHYDTLLLPAFVLVLYRQFDPLYRRWWRILLLSVSFALIAYGNEYTVLTPALHTDTWLRLLQSYKFFGMLLLWGLHLTENEKSNSRAVNQ